MLPFTLPSLPPFPQLSVGFPRVTQEPTLDFPVYDKVSLFYYFLSFIFQFLTLLPCFVFSFHIIIQKCQSHEKCLLFRFSRNTLLLLMFQTMFKNDQKGGMLDSSDISHVHIA